MFCGYIYRYTSPSNKSYIGQTIKTLERRARLDGKGYRKCPVFYRAIQKYGFENFKQEILETLQADSKESLISLLNEKESYYISYYNTMTPNGYNVRSGGENSTFSEDSKVCAKGSQHFNYLHSIDDKKLKDLYEQGHTLKSLEELTGISKGTIKRHLEDQGVLREKFHERPVVKYDKDWNIVGRWNNIREAERQENKGYNSIGRCCREKRSFYKGYTYRFEGDK